MLVIFSVGYVAMSRKKTTTGGFYSYISHGLGREIGFGAGFGSLVAYGVFEASLAGGFAYFANLKLTSLGFSASRWPRTTARSPATPRRTSPGRCTSRY